MLFLVISFGTVLLLANFQLHFIKYQKNTPLETDRNLVLALSNISSDRLSIYLKTVCKMAINIYSSSKVMLNGHYKENLQYLTITSFFVCFFQSFPNSEEHVFLATPMDSASLNLILQEIYGG